MISDRSVTLSPVEKPRNLEITVSKCFVHSRDLVARELEDGRVGGMRREPKIERNSDAAEESKVRGVLKSAQVPCEARGANESNKTPEY